MSRHRPTRRDVLVGLGALSAWPEAGVSDPAGAALDAAAALPPAQGLALLTGFRGDGLTPGRRLDLAAARAGLAIDAAIAAWPREYAPRLQRTLGAIDVGAARRRLDRALDDLHTRAAPLFDRIGIAGDSIGERYVRLFAETRDRYPDGPGGVTQAVADMNRWLADRRGVVAGQIAGVPAFCLDVHVRALSAAEIAAGKQGYRDIPSPDHPGAYIVDLRDLARRPSWSLPSVVAHETLPGHLVQLGIEGMAPPHPLRLTYASAFVEGWATYAEAFAAAAFSDPRDRLGHLHWLIFRAARARIDMGMHTEGWSLDAARARLAAWQGVPVYFAPFETDLARIAKEPGTRAAEALAWLALADRAPRDPARRGRWHRAVLAHGRKRLKELP